MMDDASQLGELLKLPNLEQETIALINKKMREMISEVKPMTPTLKVEAQNLLDEWTNGRKQGGEQ